jgi:ribosome-binding protein aMBF1 (putative translation factor)
MKTLASSAENRSEDRKEHGLPARRKRRGPVFTLTREQVFRKCLEKKHRLICAGEVLALMDLMEARGWSIQEVAEHSRISRQMISAMLSLERFPTAEVVAILSGAFGLKLFEFDLLAEFEVAGEVPLWWHGP